MIDKPVTNIETTGVTASVVERMEMQLKEDVLKEIRNGNGKLLLHDEVEIKPGVYEVIPIWETVEPENVMTPKELYQQVENEHYQVDYQRIAIVSGGECGGSDVCRRMSRHHSLVRCSRLFGESAPA